MDLFEFAGTQAPEPDRPAASQGTRKRSPQAKTPAVKVFTVSQLTRKIRFLLEASLGQVWAAGEVSNVRRQASGHTYFTLKDAGAQLSCVLFRGDARFVKLEIQDGMQLKAFGEITVYETRGNYQMIVKKLEQEGQGALQARFEELKQKLSAEGLFSNDIKRAIPRFPQTLAVITSPTGAAVRDVLNVLKRRAPWVRTIVVPAPVQGAHAHSNIAAAINLLNSNTTTGLPHIDTIILCRGGGSIEDLWSFNEEDVARAIHACSIPIISAIGHEIDFTISDFAADLRAPTPSAAAELAVPDRESLSRQLNEWQTSLKTRTNRRLNHLRQQLDWQVKGSLSREPQRVIRERSMQLDNLTETLDQTAADQLTLAQSRITEARHSLLQSRPDRVLERRAMRLSNLSDRMDVAILGSLKQQSQKISAAGQLLKSLGPQSVFNRGFSLTTTQDGILLKNAKGVPTGTVIHTQLANGKLTSKVSAPSK
ncbi:MAG: exodeoxyribonuclease VII large subunit [Verrucomicrobiales bacterium]|jgi:exodeoxyribonuclease VII large subunit